MDSREPTFYAAAYLILQKGGEILLLHRSHTGWMDGFWGLPSGHIEGAEGATHAACREAEEEVSIEMTPQEITLQHIMHRVSTGGRVYFDFFFAATLWNGEIKNAEPEKHDELKWFHLTELPHNIIPYLPQAFEHIKNGVFFSENMTDTK